MKEGLKQINSSNETNVGIDTFMKNLNLTNVHINDAISKAFCTKNRENKDKKKNKCEE